MRVLVTGAGGFIGSHLCRRLIRDGHTVTAFIRRNSDRRALQSLNVLCAEGDTTDAESANRAIKDHDAVIHAAANLTGWQARDEQDRVNVDGTRNVVNACLQSSVSRLVHISSTAAIGSVNDQHHAADEDFVFNLERKGTNYQISKRRSEEIVLDAVREGLNAVVVNPSWVFGEYGKDFRGWQMIDKVRQRAVVFCFRGGISPVYVDDVVEGIVAALARGCMGERYILAGENVSYRQIAETSAQQMGLRRHFVVVPAIVSALAASIMEPMSRITGMPPHFSFHEHSYVNSFYFYDSHKAKKELGYNPRPFSEIVRKYIRHESQQKEQAFVSSN